MTVIRLEPVDRLTDGEDTLLLYPDRLVRLGPIGAAIFDLAAGRVSLPRLARLLEQRFGTPAGVSVAEATRAAVDDLLGQRVLRRVDDDEEEQMDALRARLADLGVAIPDILLPRPSVDLHRWAVIACDQFTSQPDYWQRVEGLVGSAPSTLRLTYPEVYLGEPDPQRRITAINAAMDQYLADGVFDTQPQTLVLVRRETAAGSVRWGLLVALDLEHYSWEAEARTPIRATEGTILDRIPPRKLIRQDAPLELPHILVLISDPEATVIEPLAAKARELRPLYDTELMLGGGRVSGWAVDAVDDLAAFGDALASLHDRLDPTNPLLFAMGDGNHSFATAKSCWDDLKAGLDPAERATHPARFCLVELENIFDPGLEFEPIHRVLFGTSRADFEAELRRHCGGFTAEPVPDAAALAEAMEAAGDSQTFGYADADTVAVYALAEPETSLAAGTLQHVIDALIAAGRTEVDYIHGADVTAALGREPGNIGLFLSGVPKATFFDSIVRDGALPRKTFSMGEAEDKRYYLEARRIR